ncbi:MAG: ABC transporter substrate-binding protein [Acutalibacteraceae bacterium]
MEAERLPFGMNEIDMESIIALKPDLVILSSTNKEKYGNTLESQGTCYYVNAGPTVQYEDIKTEVQILGEAFNKKEETDAIMKKFTDLETDMAAFKEKTVVNPLVFSSPIHHHTCKAAADTWVIC